MHTTHLLYLAALVGINHAAVIPFEDDDLSLLPRDNGGNVGSYASFFPDCSMDPSYSTGTSQYKDGDGVYVSSSCDNGMTTLAVSRFHCW